MLRWRLADGDDRRAAYLAMGIDLAQRHRRKGARTEQKSEVSLRCGKAPSQAARRKKPLVLLVGRQDEATARVDACVAAEPPSPSHVASRAVRRRA